MVEILVCSLDNPLLVGIYKQNVLIKQFQSQSHTSEALIEIFDEILQNYDIKTIIYANGPGSFMGIKVAFVILKTISIVKNCDFKAISGFELNDFSPIKANKNLSFIYENGEVKLSKIQPKNFKLPQNLSNLNFISDTLPNYILSVI